MDDAHPVGPDLGRRAIGQVVEVGADASPAEHVRQLLGGTGEAAVSAHLVERVAVGLLVIAVRHQVALTHAPPLKYTRARRPLTSHLQTRMLSLVENRSQADCIAMDATLSIGLAY